MTKKDRPSWEEYFMEMAHLIKKRSTCLRRDVGAVLVRDTKILATGYNGPPKGLPHCEECLREKLKVPSGERHEISRAVHAEQNVIIQSAFFGVPTKDAILYVTNYPCVICAKMLINAGIKEIVYDADYEDRIAKEMLGQSSIFVRKYNGKRN